MSSGLLWLTAPSLGWEVKLWPGTCAQSKPQEQSSECPSLTLSPSGVSLKTASLHLVCSFVLVAGHWEGCRLSTTGVCGDESQRVVTSSSDEARRWKYAYLGGMNHCMFRHCSPCVPSQQKMGRWKCSEWRTFLLWCDSRLHVLRGLQQLIIISETSRQPEQWEQTPSHGALWS